MNRNEIIRVQNLKKYFSTQWGLTKKDKRIIHAVDNVDIGINKGETLGLVGESGCGKSTLGRTILRLIEPSSGKIYYNMKDITKVSKHDMRQIRRSMQLIFQDPYASLNPRMTILDLVKAPLDVFKIGTKKERTEKALQMLDHVSLSRHHLYKYPHEFSGGQLQRIGIARALITKPEFIVCDEPVSSLDVSVRSQVLNLLKKLQTDFNLTLLFISHDLSVVKHISDRVAVMYLGKIVEIALKHELYANSLHPYTQALLSAIPIPDTQSKVKKIILKGDIPSPYNPPLGCYFHTRCQYAKDICRKEIPPLIEKDKDHFVACHLF